LVLNCVTHVFVTNTIRRHNVSRRCILYMPYRYNILSNMVDNRLFRIRHACIQRQISVNSLILYHSIRVVHTILYIYLCVIISGVYSRSVLYPSDDKDNALITVPVSFSLTCSLSVSLSFFFSLSLSLSL